MRGGRRPLQKAARGARRRDRLAWRRGRWLRTRPRLAADTLVVGNLPLATVLLMDDSRFPWFILVPRRPGLVEITDLDEADARTLLDETRTAARVIQALCAPDKVNVAALGNIVAQLHVHVVGRFRSDPAWPRLGARRAPALPRPRRRHARRAGRPPVRPGRATRSSVP